MAILDPNKSARHNIEDLHIFAELCVKKRDYIYKPMKVGGDDEGVVKIGILNFNGDTDGLYTTNWTENKENFGITNIEFKLNASYVPQVDITFVDVRGQALFNVGSQSKYGILFDFPPPIFELTLKGFYGQAVSYRLHLLKQSSKFNSATGNFEIITSLVGQTFAPLSDIYYDFAKVAPYLRESGRDAGSGEVDTTQELIAVSRKLVPAIKKDSQKLLDEVKLLDSKYSDIRKLVNDKGEVVFVNDFISQLNLSPHIYAKLEADVLKVELTVLEIDKNGKKSKSFDEDAFSTLISKRNGFNDTLEMIGIKPFESEFKSLDVTNGLIGSTRVGETVLVYSFDLSKQPVKRLISEKSEKLKKEIQVKKLELDEKVEKTASQIMGGTSLRPTIRTVFDILLKDVDLFIDEMKKVNEKVSNDSTRTGFESVTGSNLKVPYPKVVTPQSGLNETKVDTIPSGGDRETWEEVKFVDRYIAAKFKQKIQDNKDKEAVFETDESGNYKWLPINPLDSPIYKENGRIIYNTLKKPEEFLETLIKRAYVAINHTYRYVGVNPDKKKDLFKNYGEGDGWNILNNVDNILLNALSTHLTTLSTAAIQNRIDVLDEQIKDAPSTINLGGEGNLYKFGEMDIFKASDFPNGKAPVKRDNLSEDDSKQGQLNKIINIIGDRSNTWFTDNVVLSNYNVPLFLDMGSNQTTDGVKQFDTDFFDNVIIDAESKKVFTNRGLNELLGIIIKSENPDKIKEYFSTAEKFIEFITTRKTVLIPSDGLMHEKFKHSQGIIEIPFCILATYGYHSINEAADVNDYWSHIWGSKAKFVESFAKFKELFAVRGELDDIINTYSKSNHTDDDKKAFHKALVNSNFLNDIFEKRYIINMDIVNFYKIGEGAIRSFHFGSSGEVLKNELVKTYVTSAIQVLRNSKNLLDDKKKKQEEEIKRFISDNDVRTQLYYSFKTISDRWLLGGEAVFNGGRLIDKFRFVDRAMNDIGDLVMLDLSPLSEMATTPDTSIYTVILNLLNKNNFEFFALPAFVAGEWDESNIDRIFGSNLDKAPVEEATFICMYVGGTSSQLDMSNLYPNHASFNDDGGNVEDIQDLNRVKAFMVNFGTQDQSYFKDITLDQAEFKETNESIAILDKIATNDKQMQLEQKGQNLFNVYEQRSYSCEVTMMGNVMIQPTMYFQLGNIAMFKGAYLILEVSHTITPNSMTTKFKGVRVPKYPKPLVTSIYTIAGIDTDSVDEIIRSGGGRITTSGKKAVLSGKQEDYLGKIDTQGISNQEKALLDLIAYAEGTLGYSKNGYDVLVGYTLIDNWTEEYGEGHGMRGWYNKKQNSTAAGRYQFTAGTWLEMGANLDYLADTGGKESFGGTKGSNKIFNKVNQDVLGKKLVNIQLKLKGVKLPSVNKDNFHQVTDALAPRWASFPYEGKIGYHEGQGRGFSVDSLYDIYIKALKIYSGKA